MAKDKPDLFRREWLSLDALEASALLTSTQAKITFDETGITVKLWFPWMQTPHKKESTESEEKK